MITVILFYVFAALAVAAALVVVAQRNPIYSAFGLIVTLCSLSAIFGLLGSPFIAALRSSGVRVSDDSRWRQRAAQSSKKPACSPNSAAT